MEKEELQTFLEGQRDLANKEMRYKDIVGFSNCIQYVRKLEEDLEDTKGELRVALHYGKIAYDETSTLFGAIGKWWRQSLISKLKE